MAPPREDELLSLIETIPALTFVAWPDELGSLAYVSPQLREMTGFTPAEWLADPSAWSSRLHPEDRERVLAEYRGCCKSGGSFRSEYRILDRDGRVLWWRAEARAIESPAGGPQFVRGFIVDISDRKRAEETVRQLTYRDGPTGLPNRALLRERLLEALLARPDPSRPLALLVLALGRLREITTILGQGHADALVGEVAQRLGDVVGEPERVARLRADELAFLLPGANAELALQVAAKALRALERPVMIERLPIEVTGAVGIAVAPEHGESAELLLRRADLALAVARTQDGRCVAYTPDCDPYDPGQLMLLGELRQAMDGNQLRLHYQPKVDLKTRSVVGAEALLRWHHPRRGMVPPDRFIPLAEQGGLMKPLTRWVLGEAVGQCHAWANDGRQLAVAVNLSARDLNDPRLVDQVGDVLASKGVASTQLGLELTESTVMSDPVRAADTLRRIDDSGVRISIDDFGTGYSSLAYLRKLPFSEIKIDRSFVKGIANDSEDAAIVRSTSELGHNLGLSVVAEGVEDEPTLQMLSSFGCDAAQGYYLGRPMPAAELAVWLRESPWA